MREVFLLKSILIQKKILWRINSVLIKFLPNALLFEKLQMNAKIHHFSIRFSCQVSHSLLWTLGGFGRGLFSNTALLPKATMPLSLTSFNLTKDCYPFLSQCQIHTQCKPSFPALHFLHVVVFLLNLCRMYCKLMCPVMSPTNSLQCFLYSQLMNYTYLSVSPSKHYWLVPCLLLDLHSAYFFLSIQLLILVS